MWESKMAPLSGVLFGVLLIASYLVDPNTDFMPPADEVVAYLRDGPLAVMAGAYLRLLSALALVWFAGSLHASIRRLDDDNGRLSLVAFGGGVMAACLLAAGAIVIIAAAERMWVVGTVDAGAAAAMFDIAGIAIGNGASLGFGIMIGATGIASLRAPGRYRWTGWSSVVIALGLISPYGWIVLAIVLVWVLATAIWIYRNGVRSRHLVGTG